MGYYTVAQVLQITKNLASEFPALVSTVALPYVTWEGRQPEALMLSTRPNSGNEVIMIMGGVHGAEWGSCEIALNVATMLARAQAGQAGLAFGGNLQGRRGSEFTAQQIRDLFAKRDVLILPLVNPDGREHSQVRAGLSEADWRKNRRPIEVGGEVVGIGVDINRNFDFAFDLGLYANGANPVASRAPENECYQGDKPESEAETANVVALLEQYPHIGWLVDLHSPGKSFCYSWNHDEPQSDNSSMNFRVSGPGQFGLPGPQNYREFMASKDQQSLKSLADQFAKGVYGVRESVYSTRPAYWHSAYPGTSHDYAFSRHLVDSDSSKGKILGFICEWGGFSAQPDWPDMEKVIEEVSAGLIGFSIATL